MRDENIIQDKLNLWCATIIEKFKSTHKIILATGRNEFTRAITQEWLVQNDLRYDMLLMRKNHDYRLDAIVKEEIFRQEIETNFDVLFCIDDRQQVVDAWRKLGLVCLQCNEGKF
ncbi:hypothetical protein [Fluviispira sanaruensis]|uniref:Polynucleotide kinase PNKP phosphatase domain-containing protein n=1 Tax=Fluviispira sanaruensis TaxID=2493639 RepID=A0A4P2VI62_FLUSA|nr:hypothetical protein [Fluviispira sanaruensis]BBH52763.1 hypothetical protein JCM31447_12060 [Fluviispira sanaruensis]